MFDKIYLELLEKILELDFKVLCPWKEVEGHLKPCKLFRACFLTPLILWLIITSFVYFEWDLLAFATKAENVAYIIVAARSFGYVIIAKIFYCAYKKQIDKLLADRRSLPTEPSEETMTEAYNRIEFWLTLAHHSICLPVLFVLFHAFGYFFPNAYHLPLNFYIFFMPPDAFPFAWELNYLLMAVSQVFALLHLACYLPFLYILMNQSCWLLDLAFITAADINEHLQQDEDIRYTERVAKTNENLKKFIDRCKKFAEWQGEVQELLSWYINLEFQVQSLILCFSIYVLSIDFGGIIVVVFLFCAIQLFVLCWMGERVNTRIEQLSFEVSKNWYLMTPSQRKTLQMILHWTQNMEGFKGIFSAVNLETCKAIFEASYSFYAFLQSTNSN